MACPQSTSRKSPLYFRKGRGRPLEECGNRSQRESAYNPAVRSSGFERRIGFKVETVGRRGGWFCNEDKDCIPNGGIGRRFDDLSE